MTLSILIVPGGSFMLDKKGAAKALRGLFHRTMAVVLDDLYLTLNTRSRTSVFRRLKEIGYRTSYTHAGSYYTLVDIPKFDERGLWFYQDVGFSKSGTLKATLKSLVESGPAGFTHEELEGLLHIRVYNTLLDLVRENAVKREEWNGTYLYVSLSQEVAADQQKRRQDLQTGIVVPLPATTVIEILVEALLAGRVCVTSGLVAARLAARGFSVSVEQVAEVMVQYGVAEQKKTAQGPKRSRV
jgi:hypothetical protein